MHSRTQKGIKWNKAIDIGEWGGRTDERMDRWMDGQTDITIDDFKYAQTNTWTQQFFFCSFPILDEIHYKKGSLLFIFTLYMSGFRKNFLIGQFNKIYVHTFLTFFFSIMHLVHTHELNFYQSFVFVVTFIFGGKMLLLWLITVS